MLHIILIVINNNVDLIGKMFNFVIRSSIFLLGHLYNFNTCCYLREKVNGDY